MKCPTLMLAVGLAVVMLLVRGDCSAQKKAETTAPLPPTQDFLVALTYNLDANNNSIVQLDTATGTPTFGHWWGNLVFQFTAFTSDPINRTLILMGDQEILSFKVDPPFAIAGRIDLSFSPTDIQYDYVHRKLYAVKQDQHNEIVEIDMTTGEDRLVVRFNDNYSTLEGASGFDPYNQRYFVGGSDENNDNILMQFNVATGKLEHIIRVAINYDQVFWNAKTNTLVGLVNNTLVALDISSLKTIDLAVIPGIPSLYGGAFDARSQQYYIVTTIFGQMQFTRVDLTTHPAKRQTVDIWNDFIGVSFIPGQKRS